MADGGICGSTHQCELDHVVPYAMGGKGTADELRVLCRAHNDLAARNAFGNDWMNQYSRGLGRQRRNGVLGLTAQPPP